MTAVSAGAADAAVTESNPDTDGPDPAEPHASRARRWELLAVWFLTLATFAFYGVYSLGRYKTYQAAGYDLGIFDQAVRAYSHFQAPIVPLKGASYNVLGDHFHPIIATIAPLYWIWDNPCVLLIVQAALIAGSIPVLYRFARRRTNPWLSWIICGSYAIGWAFQATADFDFHEIAFAIPLLALTIDALDRRADRQLLVYAALLLLVREDMGALLVIFGIIRLLAPRGRPFWPGASLVVGGLAGYVLATSVIIPAFSPSGSYDYFSYQDLGPNLPSALLDIVIHPWHATRVFFTPSEKSETLGYLFIPFAFLPLRSRYVFIVLPLLGERFFNSRDLLWSTHYHYNAPIWVILAFAMLDGGARLHLFKPRVTQVLLAAWLVFVPFWVTQYSLVTPHVVGRVLNGSFWPDTTHSRAQRHATARMPANTCVAVDDRLAPHLTSHHYVTLADAQWGTADFVAIDLTFADVGNFGPSPRSVLLAVTAYGYTQIYKHDGVIVLKSPVYAGPSAACHPDGHGK